MRAPLLAVLASAALLSAPLPSLALDPGPGVGRPGPGVRPGLGAPGVGAPGTPVTRSIARLPGGCVNVRYRGGPAYRCGGVYYRPVVQNNTTVYVVVD
ncbi:hypothetical protein [Amorphus coralli]|uniref:hypothetical protein n=1 Tax=Amorphus coralli TaxID=340680 RepID=UPI0003669DD0|nr:hypothetical protein [Amorphus coralli]